MNLPAPRSVLPNFALPALDGRLVSLWEYKQREPLVLVVCDQESLPLLEEFAERYPDYRRAGGQVLAVSRARPESRSLPFRVLIDREGEVTGSLVRSAPAVLVADAYGELCVRIEGPWAGGLDHDVVLGWVTFTEIQCPECGVPGPPWV
jgi:peroxiredoxin